MDLAPYRRVLRQSPVRRLLAFAVLGRIPQITSGWVLTLYVVLGLHRGYAAAGLVAAAATVASAVGAPWRGRAVDRLGLRRALIPSVVTEAFVWGLASFASYPQLAALAALGGLLGLPTFTVVRQALGVLVPQDDQRTAFALDSVGTEITFMIGPAVGVLIATRFGTRVALLALGVCLVTAGLSLIALNPPTRSGARVDTEPAQVPVPETAVAETAVAETAVVETAGAETGAAPGSPVLPLAPTSPEGGQVEPDGQRGRGY